MIGAKTHHSWQKFLDFYSAQNAGRKVRFGVFERHGDTVTDYWLGNGLEFRGITIEHGIYPTAVLELGPMTHESKQIASMEFRFTQNGDEDGVDLHDIDGRTTVVRFETE